MVKKKILFLSPYPINKAPSQRLKFEQYYSHFEAAGYDLTTRSFVSLAFWKIIYQKGHFIQKVGFTLLGYIQRLFDLLTLRKYDIVYVHLWVTPIGFPLFERMVCLLARRVIYDVDDMIHLNDQRKNNHLMQWIRGRGKPQYLMKKAQHVIVCTPVLETFARQYNQRVTDISSTINTDTYVPVNTYSNERPLVIGWSGSHSTSRYLHLLDDVLRELAQEIDFTLKVIGDPTFHIEGVNIEAMEWSAATEVQELQRIDIGLYPLPMDEEWVLGKSGLKALQYMALGIPTIATAIGANYRIIAHDVNGMLIENNESWKETIAKLANQPELRRALGTQAIRTVKEHYSIKAVAPVYLQILNQETETNVS